MNNQNAKADKGKPKLSLVPTEIINCIARCREYGTTKYHDPDNWKDVEKERYIDAAYRHWIKYVADNNSVDEESGLPHLYHCCTNLAFLCEFDKVERDISKLKDECESSEYFDIITKTQHEADVIEVKHGKCIKNAPNPDKMVEFHKLGIGKAMSVNSIFWTCSECGKWINPRDNYCPNCGARMDGDKQ